MADRLSLSFIEVRPLAAARVLTGLSPEDAAAFMETVPARLVSRVLLQMGAWSASAVLARLDRKHGAAALREMSYLEAASLLRLVAAPERPSLLAELPTRLKRDFETSLSFPGDSVGAHMRLAHLTLGSEHSVEDAMDLIARAPRGEADMVFVTNSAGRVVGSVDAATLLQCARQTALGEIARADPPLLSSRSRVESVRGLEAWDEFSSLPVVSRQGHIVGTLQRSRLRQAIDHDPTSPARQDSVVASLAQAFLVSAVGLAQLLIEGLPAKASRSSDEARP